MSDSENPVSQSPSISYADKKNLLLEALGYIAKFKGTIIVVKYGGAAMVQQDIKDSFTQDMVLLQTLGMRPVIVHGGLSLKS